MLVEAVSMVTQGVSVQLFGHSAQYAKILGGTTGMYLRRIESKAAKKPWGNVYMCRIGTNLDLLRRVAPSSSWLGIDHHAEELYPKAAQRLREVWAEALKFSRVPVLRRTSFEVIWDDDF
jgi:hypothetical protein